MLDELHTEELRELKDRIDKKDFHCDILGSLPLEIAAQITTYLEVSHLIYLQRVSKRWKFLLSTRLVRDSAVNWRYGRDLVDTDSNHAFSQFVRRRVMLDRGDPVSQSHFSWQLPSYEISRNPMDYCNGKYAWVEMDTFVFVRHLHTGDLQRFCTENRDIFDVVRITDCIVAAFSRHGSCHVWSLESGASGVFHLPSACFEKFVANGTKIAFSFRGNVLQWDFKTQATHAVPIPLGLHLIVLHPTEDRIATVHIALKESGRYIGSIPTDRAEFTVLKFSRSDGVGPFLQRSSEVLDLPSGIGPGGAFYEDVTTRKTRCNHRIGSVHINWNHQRDLTEALILTADAYTGRIYMHRTGPGSIHSCGLSVAAVAPDLLYYIRKMDGKPTLWISNALSNSEHRLSGPMTRDMRERGVSWEELDRCFILLGDGHSVLLVDPSGMRVWCFDASSQAFGAVPISY